MRAEPNWFSPLAALYGGCGVATCAGSVGWGVALLAAALALLLIEGRLRA